MNGSPKSRLLNCCRGIFGLGSRPDLNDKPVRDRAARTEPRLHGKFTGLSIPAVCVSDLPLVQGCGAVSPNASSTLFLGHWSPHLRERHTWSEALAAGNASRARCAWRRRRSRVTWAPAEERGNPLKTSKS